MPATSLPPSVLAFLRELATHNDRPWFSAQKARYERDVQRPVLAFIEAMAPRLRKLSRHVVADARTVGGSMMRIHRDTRFSKDKRPYKTNVGIQFRHVAGKDVHAPGLYVHVEPGTVFLGAGLWHPERDVLRSIREAIAARPKAWLAARDYAPFRKAFALEGDSLKRAPAGYAPDDPMIEDLRRTDFIAVRRLSDRDIIKASFADDVAKAFGHATPFMRFLCKATGVAY
jgi:uncharacterized protein (TIGR02453 family)